MDVLQFGAVSLAAMMAQDLPPVTYHCNDAAKSTIIAHFKQTDPPTVRLERGKATVTAVEGPTGSGARYVTSTGILFWGKGRRGPGRIAEGQALHLQFQTVRLEAAGDGSD